jgi:polyferredoxin
MAKIGRPGGLIDYDTEDNLQRRLRHEEPVYRIIRPRTVLYAVLIAAVSALMVYTFATRSSLGLNVLHDRNPLYVRLADGSVRNAYTVRVINTALEERPFRIEIIGIPDARLDVVGETTTADQSAVVSVDPDQTRELRVLVTVPKSEADKASRALRFRLTDLVTGATANTDDFFLSSGGTP